MRPLAFYNEIDSYCCGWLSNLMDAGLITPGKIDDRSIADLDPDDVSGFRRVHFFAGIGGWECALKLAGWDDREVWTGSCPCQPFSVAGKGRGADDERHLWPDFFRLIRAGRPAVVMGEQVAGTAGYGWLDGVCADLAGEGYASRGVDIPACAVDAPHLRNRIYWLAVADAENLHQPSNRSFAGSGGARSKSEGLEQLTGRGGICTLADADRERQSERPQCNGDALEPGQQAPFGNDARGPVALGDAHSATTQLRRGPRELPREAGEVEGQGYQRERFRDAARHTGGRNSTFWSDHEWLVGADGKQRRAQSGIRLLASGVPARVAKLRALGNAVVPPLAAEVIGAFLASGQARAA